MRASSIKRSSLCTCAQLKLVLSLSSPHCRHGIQAVEYAPTSLVIIGIVLAAIACAGCCSSFSSGVTGSLCVFALCIFALNFSFGVHFLSTSRSRLLFHF